MSGNPFRLEGRANRSFQGSIVLGTGFVIEESERDTLIKANRETPRSFTLIRMEMISILGLTNPRVGVSLTFVIGPLQDRRGANPGQIP